MFFSIFSHVLLFLLAISNGSGSDCRKKLFPGQDSFVCVCNHQHCDTLGELKKVGENEIVSFETDKAEHRFHKRVLESSSDESPDSDAIITINRHEKDQSIIGFGGAFTDATGINIATLDDKLQKRVIRDYFGKKGLEYTLGRVHIGGSDFSDRNYTLDDHENDFNLDHFALTHDDFNYKVSFFHL